MDSPPLRPLPIVTAASVRNTCGDAHHTGDAVAIEGSALPFRFDVRIATQEGIERANTTHDLQGDSRFQPVEEALAEIHQNPAGQTVARLMSWVHHPDERVAIALARSALRFEFLGKEGDAIYTASAAYMARARREARTEGTLWTPLFDASREMGAMWSEPYVEGVLDAQRREVQKWLQSHNDARIAEALLQFQDTNIRHMVIQAVSTIDERLAAFLVRQPDINALLKSRLPSQTGPHDTEHTGEMLHLRRCAFQLICSAAESDVPLAEPIRLLEILGDSDGPFAAEEIDALTACLEPLSRRTNGALHVGLWNVLAWLSDLTPQQITALYDVGSRLPAPERSPSVDLYLLLQHEAAALDWVRSVAESLRGPRWREAEPDIAANPEAAVDPAVRARLRRSRNASVLATLCATAPKREFARLVRRTFRWMTPTDRASIEQSMLALLEADNRQRVKWLRPVDLTPLFESADESIRERALLLT